MSEIQFKQVNYNLDALIQYIEIGNIGLPDIQRPFVWKNANVRDLFDSMYRGYPIGHLLFWQTVEGDVHRTIGSESKQKTPSLLIIDGQQRLTSLYTVIKGIPVIRKNYNREKIKIGFNPINEKFVVADASTLKNPEFIPDISSFWAPDSSIFKIEPQYVQKLQTSREVSDDDREIIQKNISKLYNLPKYPFTVLELSPTVDEEQVAEIFVRVNGKGTKLNQSDFILTLMSVYWDEGRTELEDFCRRAKTPTTDYSSPFNYFINPYPDQLLKVSVGLGFRRARLQYVYSILRGKDLETEEFSDELREKQFTILKEAQTYALNLQNWKDFLKILIQAGFRSSKMISSQNNLLFAYILYLIGKKDFNVDSFVLKKTIARWFFMSSLTGRYTDSPESKLESDFASLREVNDATEFVSNLDKISQNSLTEDYWNITLPNDLATSSSRSPPLFAYFASLNLLGAKVLFSKNKVSDLLDPLTYGTRSAIERHHLFPKGYLKTLGITEVRDTNQIANYALVEWDDNMTITDDSPAIYFPIYAKRFDSNELEMFRYWHALPDGWENLNYSTFIEKRRMGMAKVIRDGYTLLLDDTTPPHPQNTNI